jgi:hypothetical protein
MSQETPPWYTYRTLQTIIYTKDDPTDKNNKRHGENQRLFHREWNCVPRTINNDLQKETFEKGCFIFYIKDKGRNRNHKVRKKKKRHCKPSQAQWLTSIIPPTLEAEEGQIQGQPRQKVHKTLPLPQSIKCLAWWHQPVIPATQEAQIQRSRSRQPQHKCKTPFKK